jgi:hypothetical protein
VDPNATKQKVYQTKKQRVDSETKIQMSFPMRKVEVQLQSTLKSRPKPKEEQNVCRPWKHC